MPFYDPKSENDKNQGETAAKAVKLANDEQEQVAIIWDDDYIIVDPGEDPEDVLTKLEMFVADREEEEQ